jgi:hypothetical protein
MSDPFTSVPPAPLPQWPAWKWLLAVVLAIVVVPATVRMLRPQMDERLYAKYRNLPQAVFLKENDHPLAEACAAFNLKQYTRALPLFERDTHATYALEKQFFSALCLLELNKMKPAEERLRTVVNSQHPLNKEAVFYTALSQLRRHDRKGALLLLEQLDGAAMRHTPEVLAILRQKI